MRKLFAVLSVFVMLFFVFSFVFYPDAVYATESHDFSMGIVMIQTSCLFDGEIHYDCGHCEEIKKEIIPATGHHLTQGKKNTMVCSCGYSETKVKKFGKSHQTFACKKAVLNLKTKTPVNGEYVFDFCEMLSPLAEEYRSFYPGFSKGYLFRLELAGKPCEPTDEMTLSILLDEDHKDYDLKVAVLSSGKFYYLENIEIKNDEILINGGDLSGVEAIFLEKGERIMMSIAVPIVVTVITIILAAVSIYAILFRNVKFRKKAKQMTE